MPIYRVQGPDKHVYSFEGPEDATEAEKIAYAIHLYNQSKSAPALKGSGENMQNLDAVYNAFRAADAAGDTTTAQILADYIREQTEPQPLNDQSQVASASKLQQKMLGKSSTNGIANNIKHDKTESNFLAGSASQKIISAPMEKYNQSTVVPEQLPHIDVRAAFLEAGVLLSLAALVAYMLYKLIAPKSKAENPLELGRRWLAWFAVLCVVGAISSPRHEIEERIAAALVFVPGILLLVGPVVFFVGWLYGKYFRFVTWRIQL